MQRWLRRELIQSNQDRMGGRLSEEEFASIRRSILAALEELREVIILRHE